MIQVVAKAEPLLEVTARTPADLLRLAWHIGNRHIAAEVTDSAIYIQPDHVLEEMIRGLGGHFDHVSRPFEPEGGAYGGHTSLQHGHSHGGHSHSHEHDHDHGHGHRHDH